MNAQAIDKLWHIPGVNEVIGKDNCEGGQYEKLVQDADKKISLKMANNSFDLDTVDNKILESEEKIEKIQKARKKLEEEIKNLLAQEKAELAKLAEIENFEKKQLKEEAVALSNEIQEVKELASSLSRSLKMAPENRFFGKNGDGSSTYLRNIHSLASVSDVNNLNGRQRRALLTFATVFGAESMKSWLSKWETPPVDNWNDLVGATPGIILCHNGVTKEQAGSILFYLYDLSPVDSPIKTLKRGGGRSRGRSESRTRARSTSRGRSLSLASRGSGKKKRRFNTEELPAIIYSLTKTMMEQGILNPDDESEDESLGE